MQRKPFSLALFICAALVTRLPAQTATNLDLPVSPGPFAGTMDSLTNYTCPAWFRDAKFGIWAHWGPQAVPMEGDWYARKMYEQGSADYNDHLKRFGHPSTNGWKDIIPLWKAEHWEPEKLMELYKKAGAHYFVSMGTHHDDFFLWNSPLHAWNSVNYGPHRDVVGEWQRAAKKNGLPFGVSEHLGASFTWFQDAHGADRTGPLAGVPYDGADSNNWDLYHFPAEKGDTGWYSNNPRWQQQWYYEIKQLVDDYRPDLLYSDGGVVFGNAVGLSQIANLYNVKAGAENPSGNAFPVKGGELLRAHDSPAAGVSQAVYNCKQPSGGRWVQDFERGVNGGINPYPWQTDTSIGDWFYNRHWKYQPLSWTVHMLVDIVSKNGNLLLNVVLRPDGTLDPEVDAMLHELAGWTAVNGEAVYGSRPWLVYGEGPVQVKGGSFKENFAYTARDIRFTTQGKTLYAIALGWPADNQMVIRSLAKAADPEQNEIQSVELLGQPGQLRFTQTTNGLAVELPDGPTNALTCALRITGRNLQPVPLDTTTRIEPDASGRLFLGAEEAMLHGQNLKLENQGGKPNVGFWDQADDWVSWLVQVRQPGVYEVTVTIAAANGPAELAVAAGGETIAATIPQTTGWDQFSVVRMGQLEIKQPGEIVVRVRAKDAARWRAVNLRSVRLVPVGP